MKRIICIGNRYIQSDSLGARIFDLLSHMELPPEVELVDGGLAGLNLLPLLDGCERVIFVDTILGGDPFAVQVLRAAEVESPAAYGHAAGLGYLLGAYHALGAGPETQLLVVGAGAAEAAQSVAEAALAFACREESCQ